MSRRIGNRINFSKRAENGPTAYIVEKIDESTCKFTWILNVDLKVNNYSLFLHSSNEMFLRDGFHNI
jgi:hypothetical protein